MLLRGPKEIKVHVKRLLHELVPQMDGRCQALDIPCGNGYSLEILKELGADVKGADLFPELNRDPEIPVVYADLSKELPFAGSQFDLVLCQEGIEHVGNQNEVFNEFSRILKPGGRLVLTTPNYSSIKSRLSYLFTESEAFGRIMPPNEFDSIWLKGGDRGSTSERRVYFGHAFLTGILRLRLFAQLSGLKLTQIHSTRMNNSSAIWFPLIYPLLYFYSWKTYRRFIRKTGKKDLGKELFQLMTSPRVLLQGHLMLEFEKISTPDEALTHFEGLNDLSMTT